MQRKMLFFERLMYVDGRTPINCIMTTRLHGTLDVEHLHAALAKMQAKHPLLRARVVEQGGEPWFVMDHQTPPIPVRVVPRSYANLWRDLTLEEARTAFEPSTGPLLRIVWIQSSLVSELMLVAHHCICDGGSIMTLLREILQGIDQPRTELQPYTGYSSLEDLVPSEVLADPKQQRRVRQQAKLYRLMLSVVGRRHAAHQAGEVYVLPWKADAAQFAAMNARCNLEETNAYAALCVAYLLAFREVQGARARNKIMCPVSIRRFIRSIKSDMLFAFAPTIQLSLGKDRTADFWTRARQMKTLIGEKIDAMNVYEDLMLGDLMRPYVPSILNFLRSSRGGHDLAFSNVGRLKIATAYQTFTVETVMGATVAVPWRNTNTLVMTHFANEMDLGFISNERFLPRREAVAIHERALQLLLQAMEQPSGRAAAQGEFAQHHQSQ